MKSPKLYKWLIPILLFGLSHYCYAQNTPCTAVAAEIGTSTACSGQKTTPGSWTNPGSGIIDPTPLSTCLPAAAVPTHNYWISYTVPAKIIQLRLTFDGKTTGNASVRLHDIAVQIYESSTCTGTFTFLNCFNDAGSTIDQTLSVTPGTTYYFRVFDADGVSTTSSEFNYCFQLIHEGDNPCIAIPISTFPYTYTVNTGNNGITDWLTGGCNGNSFATFGNGNDIFFSVTVSANKYVSFRLLNTTAANWTEISVIQAPDCANGPFTCFPNGAWEGGLQATAPDSIQSPCRTVYFANAGTYYIRVDSDNNSGSFTLTADTYSPINGDACVNAMALSPGSPVSFNSNNHTNTIGNDDPVPPGLFCAGTVENTNWFYFQSDGLGAPVDVTVSNVTCNPGYFTFIPGPPGPGGFANYSAQGQFGIVTSSTGACGGTYTSAAACQTVVPGFSYTVSLANAAVTDYFMIWDGNGGAECRYTIEVTNVNPLPIQLLSFDAIVNGVQVDLYWSTATEINNDYFIIERSLNQTEFEPIAVIDGAGNSTIEINYKAIDPTPYEGKSYYRLKQVDFNGIYSYSKVVEVNVNDRKELDFTIAPNPVNTESFNIQFNQPLNENALISIIDYKGSKVFEEKIALNAKTISLKNNFSRGVYLVKLSSVKFIKTQKLIIN